MKKIIAVMLVAFVAVTLCSCTVSLYDGSDLEFVYKGNIDISPGGTSGAASDPAGGESNPVNLTECEVDGQYVCPDYTFTLPSGWRGALVSEKEESTMGGYSVITRTFYYVQLDGVRGTLMRVITAPKACYDRYKNYAVFRESTSIGTSQNGKTLFLLSDVSNPLPSDFTDYLIYIGIYEELVSDTFALSPKI